MHNRTEDLGLDPAEISIVPQPISCGALCMPVRGIALGRVHRVVREPAESVHQLGRHDREPLLSGRESLV